MSLDSRDRLQPSRPAMKRVSPRPRTSLPLSGSGRGTTAEIDAKLRALLDPMLDDKLPDDMVRMVEQIAAKLAKKNSG